MSFDPVGMIRSRSREGWMQQCSEFVTGLRIWVQEHGEAALGLGFVGGILFVAAFQIIFGLLAFGALACLTIYLVAESDSERETRNLRGDAHVGGAAPEARSARSDVLVDDFRSVSEEEIAERESHRES